MEMIEREKKALMMLNHSNIVKLLEIIEDEEKQITYLVFEYVSGGELFGYIVSNGRLSELVARKFIRQVCCYSCLGRGYTPLPGLEFLFWIPRYLRRRSEN